MCSSFTEADNHCKALYKHEILPKPEVGNLWLCNSSKVALWIRQNLELKSAFEYYQK